MPKKLVVVNVSGELPIRRRLMEMGFVKGTIFEIVRVAPFGDPIEIRLMGYNLTLRKEELKLIETVTYK